jgi:hypothetical protein
LARGFEEMKRCPQCNRVETDESLKFCRVDGAILANDSSPIDQEAGTIRLGSGNVSSEVATGALPQTTDANINRATATTTVLPLQPAASGTEFSITVKRRLNAKGVAVIITAIAALVAGAIVVSYRSRNSSAASFFGKVLSRETEIRDASCKFVDRVVGLAVETIHQSTRKNTKSSLVFLLSFAAQAAL